MLTLPVAAALAVFAFPTLPSQDVRKLERTALGKDESASYGALKELAEVGADAVPVLARIVERGEGAPRFGALRALRGLGATALPALPALEELCGDPRHSEGGDFRSAVDIVGWHAARGTLRYELFAHAENAVNRTDTQLVELEWFEQPMAHVALGAVAMHDVGPVLERAAADRKRARSIATGYDHLLVALGHGMSRAEAPPIDALEALLGHADPVVRQAAALLLGATGSLAAPAIDELVRLVADPDRTVAARAVEALGAVGMDTTAARAALEPLCEERGLVGSHAVRSLALLCQGDDALRKGLSDLAESRDVVERRIAASGFGRLDVPRATELEALGELLGDRDASVRIAAVGSVRNLGPKARTLMAAVERRITAEKLEEILRLLEFAKSDLAG